MIASKTALRLFASFAVMCTVAACGQKAADTTTTTTTTADATAPAAAPAADATAAAPAAPAAAPAATDAAAAPAATAAAAPAAGGVTYASFKGDATKGANVFVQCKTCHVAEKGVNRVGPSLWAVVGRHSGSIEGFKYSPANKNSGIVWTEEELFTYLEHPQKTIPGTYMSFAGLKSPQDRADVIAYLKTKA